MRRLALATALVALGCGAPSGNGEIDASGPCVGGVDVDGDGFGVGCPSGPDCDDADPTTHESCSGCSESMPMAGCPCDPGAPPVSCFDGTPQEAQTPPCAKGTRTCDAATSTWGLCEGQTLPSVEVCDYEDNDCDGMVDDDGVLSMCGDCTPGCDTTSIGEGTPFPFPPGPLPADTISITPDGVGLNPDGDLILDVTTIENHYVWPANAGEGTVSKLDSRTGREVARYASVTHASVVDVMGVGAVYPPWGGANSPSRTAVDYFGNVWVANRAFGYQPSATKIYNDVSDCVDRNGNGAIDTSWDANADGVITLSDPAEFFGEEDECIAFTVVVGSNNGYARAAAIDSGIEPGDPGNAWIGIFNEQAFYQLDGHTGALVRRVPPTGALGISPYGAAIDSMGRLWAPNGCCGNGGIMGIDTVTGAVLTSLIVQSGVSCGGSYGIAIDLADRVWLGAWSCGSALRYDPSTGSWAEATVPGYFGNGWGSRGIGADGDGNVWIALHTQSWTGGAVARIDADTATSTGVWDIGGIVPVGAAVDFDGDVWTVNGSSNNASRLHIDPATNEPAPHPDTGNTVDVFPVGSAPYTYSDFTGFGLRNITRPSGDYTVVMEGCADGDQAHWTEVDFDATAPAGTEVQIWVRAGDDLATLGSQPQYGPWTVPPANLQVPPGPVPDSRYLQVTLRLISEDRETSPIVHSYGVTWTCPSIPEG